jgi:hypothetical protein
MAGEDKKVFVYTRIYTGSNYQPWMIKPNYLWQCARYVNV